MKSQNGYPVLDSVEDCKRYIIDPNRNFSVPLSSTDAGWALALLLRRFHNRVEPLGKTETFGYNKRKIAGRDEWSNHASATAVDANSSRHPYGRTDTFTPEQLKSLRKVLADFDGIVKWGGDYRGEKDEMHFEIVKEPQAVALVVKRLKRYGKVYPKRLLPGKRNLDVYMVKRELKNQGYDVGVLNKYFGKGLTRALVKFQRDNNLNANGAADHKTLRLLGFKPQD